MRAALLVSLLCARASACGFTVHQISARRALLNYYQPGAFADSGYEALLSSHVGALLGGAPFPDYLYTCGSDHDDGEWAHWSRFQANASNLLRSLGGAFASERTRTLTAFFHGVVSHYVSDLQWHGMAHNLGGFGLIQTVGMLDYNTTGLDWIPHQVRLTD